MSAGRRALIAGLVLLAACGRDEPARPGTSAPATSESRPNVVVILIDTLRPDHLPSMGYATDTAPFLTSLAERSTLCRRAWSSSTWTAPATASLFTSLYPPQHGIVEGFFVHRTRAAVEGAPPEERETISLNRLPRDAVTLPEHFQRAGWKTWALSANVNVTERMGFDRGFDRFVDLTGPEHGKGAAADVVLAQLETFAKEMYASPPYFLYLHLNDAHGPWKGRAPNFVESADALATERSAYDSEIRFVDEAIKVCYRALAWEKNTLLCVVSDHGEEFEEHGGRGHGFSLYGELLSIAMLVHWPGRVREGARIDDNVGIVDVFPTLAELAGCTPPERVEGRSFAPLLQSAEATADAQPLFAHRADKHNGLELWAVIAGTWKLIEREGARELYDLAADPGERNDLSAARPEVVAKLAEQLASFRARATPRGSERVDVQLDQRQLDALRKLGYTR